MFSLFKYYTVWRARKLTVGGRLFADGDGGAADRGRHCGGVTRWRSDGFTSGRIGEISNLKGIEHGAVGTGPVLAGAGGL